MTNVSRFDPFADVMDDLLRGFFVRPVGYEPGASAAHATGRIVMDVTESDNAYRVSAEMPGVHKEDIQVTINGNQVSLAAEVKKVQEAAGEKVLRSERFAGKLARTFQLAQEIDEGSAQAKFDNGVLELVLPKRAAVTAKKLVIE